MGRAGRSSGTDGRRQRSPRGSRGGGHGATRASTPHGRPPPRAGCRRSRRTQGHRAQDADGAAVRDASAPGCARARRRTGKRPRSRSSGVTADERAGLGAWAASERRRPPLGTRVARRKVADHARVDAKLGEHRPRDPGAAPPPSGCQQRGRPPSSEGLQCGSASPRGQLRHGAVGHRSHSCSSIKNHRGQRAATPHRAVARIRRRAAERRAVSGAESRTADQEAGARCSLCTASAAPGSSDHLDPHRSAPSAVGALRESAPIYATARRPRRLASRNRPRGRPRALAQLRGSTGHTPARRRRWPLSTRPAM